MKIIKLTPKLLFSVILTMAIFLIAFPHITKAENPINDWSGSRNYYYDENGKKVTGWQEINGIWYYFNEANGKKKTDGWVGQYYLNDDGEMVVSDWVEWNGKTYYVDENGAYVTGWREIDGDYFYFENSGALLTNTTTPDGYKVDEYGAWIQDEDADIEEVEDEDYEYDEGSDTGFKKVEDDSGDDSGDLEYYENGSKVTGWKQIDGKSYFFDSNGVMIRDQYVGSRYINAAGVWEEEYDKDTISITSQEYAESKVSASDNYSAKKTTHTGGTTSSSIKVPDTDSSLGTSLSEDINVDDVISGANNFLNAAPSPISAERLKGPSDAIYTALVSVGIVIIVIVGAALGVKFLIGTVEEQANVKKTLIPYLIGTVIIIAAFGIWRLVLVLVDGIQDTETSTVIELRIDEEIQLGKTK